MKFIFLFLLLLATESSNTPPTKVLTLNTLHIIGDSQACGIGFVTSKVKETKAWTNTKITCKGGTRIEYWNSHIADASIKQGDSVLVFLGSNDWGKIDPRPITTYIAHQKAGECLWVGPPLIYGKDNGVGDRIKKAVELDGTCRFLDSKQLYLQQPDRVHTSEPGRWLSVAIKELILKR